MGTNKSFTWLYLVSAFAWFYFVSVLGVSVRLTNFLILDVKSLYENGMLGSIYIFVWLGCSHSDSGRTDIREVNNCLYQKGLHLRSTEFFGIPVLSIGMSGVIGFLPVHLDNKFLIHSLVQAIWALRVGNVLSMTTLFMSRPRLPSSPCPFSMAIVKRDNPVAERRIGARVLRPFVSFAPFLELQSDDWYSSTNQRERSRSQRWRESGAWQLVESSRLSPLLRQLRRRPRQRLAVSLPLLQQWRRWDMSPSDVVWGRNLEEGVHVGVGLWPLWPNQCIRQGKF